MYICAFPLSSDSAQQFCHIEGLQPMDHSIRDVARYGHDKSGIPCMMT